MSISTIIGVLFGFGLFLGAVVMSTDNYMAFLDVPSLAMVFGGSIAVAFMSYQARYVVLGMKGIGQMFKKPTALRESLNKEIKQLIEWGYAIQGQKGVVVLEKAAGDVSDPLMKFGVTCVAMRYTPEDVKGILSTFVESAYERNSVSADVLKGMGATAPAFGMMGTLVGLVTMLQGLDSDPSQIGPGMAVALLTTLYGVLFARLIFLPAAEKLQQKEDIMRFRNLLVVEGMVMLAETQSPRFMQDKLNSYLDPSIQFDIDTQLKR